MLHKHVNEIKVIQIDYENKDYFENAILNSNTLQDHFHFSYSPKILNVDKKYKLKNGGYDLDAYCKNLCKISSFNTPVIFLTSLQYSGKEKIKEDGHSYDFDCNLFNDKSNISIISTYLWEELFPDKELMTYILLMLATITLSYKTGLTPHESSSGCLFDYYSDVEDLNKILNGAFLCKECTKKLEECTRNDKISMTELSSIRRIFNRAINRKYCFMAMPFKDELKPFYDNLKNCLSQNGYYVVRGDELGYPRKITDRILLEIHSSILMIADITGANPNVFYEIGVAHTAGIDVVLITQDNTIPFDLRVEMVLKYKPSKRGARQLSDKILQFS